MEKRQKWLRLDGDDEWQVVIPDFDSKPHANKLIKKGKMELAWLDCPCKPKIDIGNKIIVHNSFIDMAKIDESINKMKNPTEQEKLVEEFYKECGQYCNDPFDEIANWWLDRTISKQDIEKWVEENKKEISDSYSFDIEYDYSDFVSVSDLLTYIKNK